MRIMSLFPYLLVKRKAEATAVINSRAGSISKPKTSFQINLVTPDSARLIRKLILFNQ